MSAEQFSETATRVPEEPGPKEYFAVTPLTTCPHVDQLSVDPIKISAEGFNAMEKCKKCANVGENWVCLKCMEVNCSRFIEGHALEHHEATDHPLALSFADISIWCYPCNAYIDNPALTSAKEAAMKAKFGDSDKSKEAGEGK